MENVIYKITSPSGKCYIGRTNDFNRRMIEHKSNALHNSPYPLYKAIRKYGWENMKCEIVCSVDEADAQRIEEEMILLNNSVKRGYNATFIGGGGDQWIGRKDTIEYMEFVEKMRKGSTGKKNGMYGKIHTKSTKKLLKEKAKGRFSLQWFMDKYGAIEGTQKYEERCVFLKNRNLARDEKGRILHK